MSMCVFAYNPGPLNPEIHPGTPWGLWAPVILHHAKLYRRVFSEKRPQIVYGANSFFPLNVAYECMLAFEGSGVLRKGYLHIVFYKLH